MKNATRVFTSTFGAIWALAGIEHGVGEILQGSIAPSGLMFPSWPNSTFFKSLGGEPAMTVIPNLLIAGILTIFFSAALLIWAIFFIQRKNGGLIMILISIGMLLAGGGIFPPTLGVITGAVATRIRANSSSGAQRSSGLGLFMAKLWPWSFAACIVAWLALFPGLACLGYFFGIDNPTFILALMGFAFAALILAVFSAFAFDRNIQPGPNGIKFNVDEP